MSVSLNNDKRFSTVASAPRYVSSINIKVKKNIFKTYKEPLKINKMEIGKRYNAFERRNNAN